MLAALAESIRQHGVIQPILVPRRSTAISSSPANGVCARAGRPRRDPCDRAQLADPSSSSWRWSRTSSARISTRSKPRVPIASSSTSSPHPGGARRPPRPLPIDHREHPPAARARSPSRTPSSPAGSPRATRARLLASRPRRRRGSLEAVVAKDLSVRQTEALVGRARESAPSSPAASPRPTTLTWSSDHATSATRWAPASPGTRPGWPDHHRVVRADDLIACASAWREGH